MRPPWGIGGSCRIAMPARGFALGQDARPRAKTHPALERTLERTDFDPGCASFEPSVNEAVVVIARDALVLAQLDELVVRIVEPRRLFDGRPCPSHGVRVLWHGSGWYRIRRWYGGCRRPYARLAIVRGATFAPRAHGPRIGPVGSRS